MLTFDRVIAEAAWPLAAILSALLGALIAFVVIRRVKQKLEWRLSDRTRTLCAAALDGLVTSATEYQRTLAELRRRPAARVSASIQSILTADKDLPPGRAALLKALCEDLGLVARWRYTLADDRGAGQPSRPFSRFLRRRRPLSFVLRAEAAENLGLIHHHPSWRLLVKALDDPSGAVRFAAARSLAKIREPESFAALADRLEAVAQETAPRISVPPLKMALASFPVTQALALRPLLQHAHRRVRFLASDVVALMLQRDSAERQQGSLDSGRLPPKVAEIFLKRLADDEDSDVRARAASVIARLEPAHAMPVLAALLGDPAWFVRLHAVRALRHQKFAPLSLVSQRLTDPNWRVREAAAQTLTARGRSGVQELLEHFLTTEDLYSQQQVVEQIERSGLLPSVLEAYGDPGRELETRFIEKMVLRGFGGVILPALQNDVPAAKARAVAEELSLRSNAHVDLFLRRLAGFTSTTPDERAAWPASKYEPAAPEAESVAAVEAS